MAIGQDVGLPGLRPHRLRHTYATRLRQGGADAAQVQALLSHTYLETAARYLRAGPAEQAAVVERYAALVEQMQAETTAILALADELAKGTIETVLAKSDLELGIEALRGGQL
ncbi:tyrosine-type recombinase/integrase [Streptosporangium sp. G11]|uniref:tyrosine-type recombinase/integrase n=1 Tax=Streptosporangium sp. G11 TaxID=3436926 RepID=UPI003EB79190